MLNDTNVITGDNTEAGVDGPVASLLGGVIVVLMVGLVVQYLRAEKMKRENETGGNRMDSSVYNKSSGQRVDSDNSFAKAEEGRNFGYSLNTRNVNSSSPGSKSPNGWGDGWMVQTDFLSKQWSIQHGDIDFELEKDGKKKVVGEGSFGKIYLGEYQGLKCAVKEIKIKEDCDEDEVEDIQKRFLMELQLVMELRHPNILNTMGGMWDGAGQQARNMIVSEFCHLGNLQECLKRVGDNIFWTDASTFREDGRTSRSMSGGNVTLRSGSGIRTTKLDWCKQIALGLTYLHGRKPAIMHRDLKCANVLVDTGFIMKITDFGESRHKAEGEMTMTGTAYFMAPEVFAGNGRYNEKCDVYSFAMLLLEIHNNGDIRKFFNGNHGRRKSGGQVMHSAANGWRPDLAKVARPIMSAEEKAELLKNKGNTFKRSNTGRRECDDHLYMPFPLIMMIEKMWNQDPNCRPTMAEISVFFKKCCSGEIDLDTDERGKGCGENEEQAGGGQPDNLKWGNKVSGG